MSEYFCFSLLEMVHGQILILGLYFCSEMSDFGVQFLYSSVSRPHSVGLDFFAVCCCIRYVIVSA